ncbi:MAG TPA: bifunctional hydroxymethylpyrimidine kinase/phosphomethylpyrimidine kinase [Methanospirillum sp.]|uniref:bifunctional hydroxymethylpyrimidine kinase/phosphomethylpyrimidine kinase n=1 Tax=Methanospirillum sp. TaxID=45200 RepID=UPI002D0D0948|nr:bifunctional hydroxymethylpyrimidine kinase/phosphomethylpyrimidine kinase [Methanospirillum sp.]HOJ95433.1 bifunctional hydroxymethylpyrimidine kinase/phosphomethylpyrimidine kinase [Methanospirillum sp.]
MTEFPAALTIAGSDPSGGAGIQMDLRTFAKTGVWGMAVITALTAQNAAQVTGSWPLEPVVVQEQIRSVLEDITPGAVKTGMLANDRIIQVVSEGIAEGIPLVIDPVMVSTSGFRLLDADAINTLCNRLIPEAFLVTPNIPEAEILSGIDTISSPEEMEKAGEIIMDMGAEYVLVKGGHGTGHESVDLLISERGVISYKARRLPYAVHGSGCSFSAAITGYLAQGHTIQTACEQAKQLISIGIIRAISGKSGHKIINP